MVFRFVGRRLYVKIFCPIGKTCFQICVPVFFTDTGGPEITQGNFGGDSSDGVSGVEPVGVNNVVVVFHLFS
jgi:hypothetical protein